MEMSRRDLDTVRHLRQERVQAVTLAKNGDIRDVLTADPGSARARVYVVKLLDVHPSMGKVKGRRLLATMGLSHFVRVSDLDGTQVARLMAECGEAP